MRVPFVTIVASLTRWMRTVTIGLLVLGLLGSAVPTLAQTADPLGLISAGALVPYVGSGKKTGDMAFLLLSSPVGSNGGESGRSVAMVLFDNTCTRSGPTVGIPLTTNDVELVRLDLITNVPTSGLAAIAAADDSELKLVPLSNPIHARMLWMNPAQDFVRTLDPITLRHAEATDTSQVWNPLRTAASFYADVDTAKSKSELVLICPTKSVITGAFPTPTFPELVPAPVDSGATTLRLRVYDTDESFLRDLTTTCTCLSRIPLKTLDPIYGNVHEVPDGTYTEISGGTTSAPLSFTGYLATRAGGRDWFSRLNNGNILSLQGTLTTGSR